MALPRFTLLRVGVLVLATAALVTALAIFAGGASGKQDRVHNVTIPDSDRFTPFALTIRQGDSVKWTNTDTDQHSVVSDDAFNSTDNAGTNQVIPSNSSFTLTFKHPGTFVYFCRFHAHLDELNQPVAPGPDGGIQDSNGNFGTPMSGVITVQRGNAG
jgi:plastocyanin